MTRKVAVVSTRVDERANHGVERGLVLAVLLDEAHEDRGGDAGGGRLRARSQDEHDEQAEHDEQDEQHGDQQADEHNAHDEHDEHYEHYEHDEQHGDLDYMNTD